MPTVSPLLFLVATVPPPHALPNAISSLLTFRSKISSSQLTSHLPSHWVRSPQRSSLRCLTTSRYPHTDKQQQVHPWLSEHPTGQVEEVRRPPREKPHLTEGSHSESRLAHHVIPHGRGGIKAEMQTNKSPPNARTSVLRSFGWGDREPRLVDCVGSGLPHTR